MNEIIVSQKHADQAMDSDEIAELVESRPDNVKRTIERLALKGIIALPPMEEKPTAGRSSMVYVFSGEKGKRDSIIVVAQLSPQFTARLVDRWQELEKAIAKPIFDLDNPVSLRQALLGYTEKVIELEHKVAELTPKAKALDTIADTAGTYCIRDCAKNIGIQESKLIQMLIDKKWIYREGGKLKPYATKIQSGVFVGRLSPVITNKNTGEEQVHINMRVTAFGLTRITGLVNRVRGIAA